MIYSMENRADQEKVMKNDEYVLDKQNSLFHAPLRCFIDIKLFYRLRQLHNLGFKLL